MSAPPEVQVCPACHNARFWLLPGGRIICSLARCQRKFGTWEVTWQEPVHPWPSEEEADAAEADEAMDDPAPSIPWARVREELLAGQDDDPSRGAAFEGHGVSGYEL